MKEPPHPRESRPNVASRKRHGYLVVAVLLLTGVLIYWQFLFGDALLLYRDIGSDSLNDYYPCFVQLSDYVRNVGLPSWSFHFGMGQDLYSLIGYLILQPVTWLPGRLIATALVYQHLLKILIAGFLFFSFLKIRDLRHMACLLGALLVAFSAYMTMGSCWYPLADEVVCFSGLLLAVECFFKKGWWLLLPLAVAFIGLLGAFHLYLCALCLLFYVPARFFGLYGWQPRSALRLCLPLAGLATLGVGIGAVITLPNLYALLNSPRGSGTTSFTAKLSSFPLFGWESPLHYVTAILRPIANDALGTANNFRGWGNYLEAPLSYCGLICFALLPQVFVGATRRQRIIYGLFLALIGLPTIFPWFRYLFWAFQGDYYRTYSLFWVLGVTTLSAIAFSRYLTSQSLSLLLLGCTVLAVVGFLCLPIPAFHGVIDPELRLSATIYLCGYGILLAGTELTKHKTIGTWLLIALVAIESIQFNKITVTRRETVKKHELVQGIVSDPETVKAVEDIKSSNNCFYRLTALRQTERGTEANLNDAMVLGYYGTSSYTSFNNVNYTSFLTAIEAVPAHSETETRWALGLAGNFIPAIFGGEKYALVDDPVPFEAAAQYELVRRYGKRYLFRNTLFLPFGLTFSRYLPEVVFRELSRDEKESMLLAAAVLPSQDADGLAQATPAELQSELEPASFPALIEERRKTALNLTSFRQTRIEGTVRLEQKCILVLQTPFDRGWRAFQDGQPARVLKADVGLLGVILDPGEHKVEVRYSTPLLPQALALSLVSLAITGIVYWRWPCLPLPA